MGSFGGWDYKTSRRPFSAVSGWNVGADQGYHPSEGGESNGAGISGFHVCWAEIIKQQNSAWGPL